MAAVNILGASKTQADKAGQTYSPPAVTELPGTPPPTTLGEFLGGEFDSVSLFGGGVHPESAAGLYAPQPTAVERPTDSLAGRLGGLIARPAGTQASGPAGGAAAAQSTLNAQATSAVATTRATVRSAWQRLIGA